MSRAGDSSFYRDKVCLAPMVRAGRTPLRVLSTEYGADLAYTEEIVDKRLLMCKRIENKGLGTVDFMNDAEVVLRIDPIKEKDKCVLQIGTRSAELSVDVIKMLERDVAAIDINMGCPKPFSISGGMGAALLAEPDIAKQILTALVANSQVPVSAKIRVFKKREETLEFAKMVQSCGVAAIGVHGRWVSERPTDQNRVDEIRDVAEYLSIPVLANGSSGVVKEYEDIQKFREDSKASGVLIARAALSNPSIFRKEGKLEMKEEIERFMEASCQYDEPFSQCKYVVQRVLGSAQQFDPRGQKTALAGSVLAMCKAWDMEDRFTHWKKIHTDNDPVTRKRKMEEVSDVKYYDITFPTKKLRMCQKALTPKCCLRNHCFVKQWKQPTYSSWKRESDGRWETTIEVNGEKHQSRVAQMNKRMSEQVASLCVCIAFGIRDQLEGEWEE